jgi:SAM-dependent methyltransferase
MVSSHTPNNMSSVLDHYASHLAPIYLWMAGGFENAVALGTSDLAALGIRATANMVALDLGAGFGMHAIPLARQGCEVTAVDTSSILLDELRTRAAGLPILAIEGDLVHAAAYATAAPHIVLCMGDTLTHIQTQGDIATLFEEVSRVLAPGGVFAMTFRDYTTPAIGDKRFIPVRSDENRIHTCFLEAEPTHIVVHDIVHERVGTAWQMIVSSYRKVRLAPEWAVSALRKVGLNPTLAAGPRGMVQITARAPEAR